MTDNRLPEAAATAAAGAALGGAFGSLFGVAVPAALIAGANGAVSGWRAIYDWGSSRGVGAFALDSTWALATTSAGLVSHALGALRGDAGYVEPLSRRRNRHVYTRGFQPRRGFAITLGNVIAGAGDLSRPRRAKLVTDHEDVHVWQARAFGPAYPVLYVGWMVGGGVAGALVWLLARRDQPFGRVVESCAYYMNPFEWWAYSRDDHWPPSGMVDRLGWKRPLVRSFASFR
ncbi:MAG: hypothetical protein QNJ12_07110 [Ilumatobacter sp.]|uniref:hypothetical protein n=1 Tax=Ilumatobacter sp. TaxID=1967498 RepID=UPI00261E926F|nr:hypothetical protein [Ilumatobacter sp.]MDJ0768546.1 hypothetical protein [Ilumatobacter sp.]